MNALKLIHTELLTGSTMIVPDIETLGVTPSSMILSIGAVAIRDNRIVGEFYQNILVEGFENFGFTSCTSTVDWWNKEEQSLARQDLQDDQILLEEALEKFKSWILQVDGNEIWGYGSDFDVVILKNAFDTFGIDWPFNFWNHRCLRTLSTMLGIKVKREKGVHHNALADAINQGQTLIECLKHIDSLNYVKDNILAVNDRDW